MVDPSKAVTTARSAAASPASSQPESSATPPSSWMDCRRLLDEVASQEAIYLMTQRESQGGGDLFDATERTALDPSQQFGHPQPPRLHLLSLSSTSTGNAAKSNTTAETSGVIMVLAYTNHCVCAQFIKLRSTAAPGENSDDAAAAAAAALPQEEDPVVICSLPWSEEDMAAADDGDAMSHSLETITCLMAVVLDEAQLLSSSADQTQQVVEVEEHDDRAAKSEDEGEDPSAFPSRQNVPHKPKSLLTGFVNRDDDQSGGSYRDGAAVVTLDATADDTTLKKRRVVVVLGTSHSRLYTTELWLDPNADHVAQTMVAATLLQPQHEDDDGGDGQQQHFPSSNTLWEVLPRDDNPVIVRRMEHLALKQRPSSPWVAFQPAGGVTRIFPFATNTTSSACTHVWVTYGDGTLVRLHHSGLFPSMWERGATLKQSLDSLLGTAVLVRCRVQLPPLEEASRLTIVPLPRYHPSPLAPLPQWNPPYDEEKVVENDSNQKNKSTGGGRSNGVVSLQEDDMPDLYDAMVFGGAGTDTFPTLVFYTSENPFVGRIQGDNGNDEDSGSLSRSSSTTTPNPSTASESVVLDAVVGGTKALVGGVMGSAIGALRWGFGQKQSTANSSTASMDVSIHSRSQYEDAGDADSFLQLDDTDHHKEVPSSPFPTLWRAPVRLYAGYEFHDVPRQVEFCSIDPDGEFAAMADGLGRVILVDLSTKQVIRMWKGYRQATCHWIKKLQPVQASGVSMPSKKTLYLVVHTRQRRTIEVWRVLHGPRVSSLQVGRDAQVLSCAQRDGTTSCFVVHSNVPGAALNQIEQIDVETAQSGAENHVSSLSPAAASTTASSLRLQHLKQLLSTSNFTYTQEDVYQALCEIKSLGDLATSLDLIASSACLEERLGVQGSSFQKQVLQHCQSTLHEAATGENQHAITSPSAKLLSRKIEYHARVVKAYDILYGFKSHAAQGREQKQKSRSQFCIEAMEWHSTFELVTGATLAAETTNTNEMIKFSTFAASCVFPKDDRSHARMKVYLSESTRTRKSIIVHIFKPLLGDVFSFGVVNSFFESLGVHGDLSYILKCFGEWFVTMSGQDISQKGLAVASSPINRFLQTLASRQLEEDSSLTMCMSVLHRFCEESTDLIRAFMLSALCRDAVKKISKQKETTTYGKISSSRLVSQWEDLLRKLRVCLLVSLRLKVARLGPVPLSVHHINTEDAFSIFEWVAHDELKTSHHHDEIVSLEKACKMSSHIFDPSTPDGDGHERCKVLQKSCLASVIEANIKGGARSSKNDTDSGSLLLFLSNHNEPVLLAAHRALILSSEWSREPRYLQVFGDALMALRSLTDAPGYAGVAFAVRLEVWHRTVCPIYRARLFGFADVQELSEEVVAPLLQSREWLLEFGRMALLVLDMLSEHQVGTATVTDSLISPQAPDGETWPPSKPDYILKKLGKKVKKINNKAIDVHCILLCGLLASDDIENLVKCVPAIYDCFLTGSLFNDLPTSAPGSPEQHEFLSAAAIKQAQAYEGPAMDGFIGIEELEMMSKLWGYRLKTLRTLYLLAMYGLGKDRFVDDLLTKAFALIDVPHFVAGGVDLACYRLSAFLSSKNKRSSDMRGIMSVLDADVCEWLQQRAAMAMPMVETPDVNVPVAGTHLFALRLLSLSASADVDPAFRARIHALAVLSGTLVKAIEEVN